MKYKLLVAACLMVFATGMNGGSKFVIAEEAGQVSSVIAQFRQDELGNVEPNNLITTKYVVTVNSANVRTGPGVGYSVLATLSKGSVVYVKSINNGWASISYRGQTAYIASSNISKS